MTELSSGLACPRVEPIHAHDTPDDRPADSATFYSILAATILVWRREKPLYVGEKALDETDPLYRAHQHAYQSIAAYCHDYDRRFYSGDTVSRRVEIFNDVLSDSELRFSWMLSRRGQVIAHGGRELQLAAGTKQRLAVDLPMPEVDTRTPLAWRLMIQRDGKKVFDETHHYSVFPRLMLPNVAARLGLYDPRGATADLLTRRGVEFIRVAALEADFMPRSATTLECEQMTPKPDMPHYNLDGSTAYMGSNGYIRTTIQVAQSRQYALELVASGDDSEGIYPLVELRRDGNKAAEVQLTTEGWRSYRFDLELVEGEHELSIWFVNDHNSATGDRNLRLDRLLIYNE